MDINEQFDTSEEATKCFKCELNLLDNLNIANNSIYSMFVLWNKYQIFVYEDLNFESAAKIFVPEFIIHQLLVTNNHLICLDCSGNIHTTPLKFKNSAQKRFKSTFQPRAQGVLRLFQHDDTHILSIGYESNTYHLNFHTTNSDFQQDKRFLIKFDTEPWTPDSEQQKCIITSHSISGEDFEAFKGLFSSIINIWRDYAFVIFSIDKVNVYCCIVNKRMPEEEVDIVKLYTSPSEICDIKIADNGLAVYIGLTIGTLVKLKFKETANAPELAHLNTALYKFYIFKNNVIYTDGMTMWKVDNVFNNDIKFQEFFVKNIKDFIKFNEDILTTTFTKLFYLFSIEKESSYLKQLSTREYCAAEKLLSNAEYLYRIMKEVDKNKLLVEQVNEVSNYLIALALANRQDLMDRVIQTDCCTYESYSEAMSENNKVSLTNKLHEYFDTNSSYICINISRKDLHHTLNQILSNKFGDKKLHITLSTRNEVVSTTSISLKEITNSSYLIPIAEGKLHNDFQLSIELDIVTNIPGSHDERKDVWIVLYRNYQVLHSEHFLRTNLNTESSHCLKDNQEISESILKTLIEQHGDIVEFYRIGKNLEPNIWCLYIKLPYNYKDIFSNRENYPQSLGRNKINSIFQQLNLKSFVEAKWEIVFVIAKSKVKISIVNDEFSVLILKICSENKSLCSDFRLFLSNLIHGSSKEKIGQEFVSSALYTTVENLQKAVKTCVDQGLQLDDFLPLADQFQKCIIGALPL